MNRATGKPAAAIAGAVTATRNPSNPSALPGLESQRRVDGRGCYNSWVVRAPAIWLKNGRFRIISACGTYVAWCICHRIAQDASAAIALDYMKHAAQQLSDTGQRR